MPGAPSRASTQRPESSAMASIRVARATVAGIYQRARRKLADALVHGRALRITGGEVRLCEHGVHCCGRCGAEACGHCTRCGTN